jgi:hypothetical protein
MFEWTSFNHAQCNDILQARNVSVGNYLPFKAGWEREDTIPGFVYLTLWLTLVSGTAGVAWRPQNRLKMRTQRIVAPFFVLWGLLLLCFHLRGAAEYVDACRSLLNVK